MNCGGDTKDTNMRLYVNTEEIDNILTLSSKVMVTFILFAALDYSKLLLFTDNSNNCTLFYQ